MTIGKEIPLFWISPRKVASLHGFEKDRASISWTAGRSASFIRLR